MKNKLNQIKNVSILKNFSIPFVAASIVLGSFNASAGAWVPEKGNGYIKLGYADFTSTGFRGNNPDFVSFDGENTSLYVEHGLGNKFAVFGSLLYQSYDQNDTELGRTTASGLGDAEIGIRYNLISEPFVLSTSLLLKTPFLYDEDDGLGNDQEDYEFKLLLGKGLNKYGYVGAEVGYRLRSGEPSDEYRYLLEYGFNVNKNVYFRAKLDGILSADNSDSPDVLNEDNLSNPLEFDSGKIEFATGWNFDKNSSLKGYGLEFTYTREIYGDNILEGNTFQLGITKVY